MNNHISLHVPPTITIASYPQYCMQLCEQLHAAQEGTPDHAIIQLPFDTAYQQHIQSLVIKKKKLQPNLLVIIGIGGSNLGTQAIHEAYYGTLYKQKTTNFRVLYADTVDPVASTDLYNQVRHSIQQGHTILINVVSKSGTTIESLIHFSILFDTLRTHYPDNFHEYIVITTDADSFLWHFAKKHGIDTLEIPKKVGGRFSVLSAVGLFPLAMMDIPVHELLQGAQSITKNLLSCDSHNIAATSACILYQQYQQNIHIQDMFVFTQQLRSFAAWYRQLMAESLGKEKDIYGNTMHIGITPTVSIGTTDLHSVGQLYWGGPYDKCSTFVTVERFGDDTYLGTNSIVPDALHNASLSSIFGTIIKGVFAAYQGQKRPYLHITLPQVTPYYMGQLLQYKIIEIVYLGYLLKVNPFDQPNVELYKTYAKKFLGI